MVEKKSDQFERQIERIHKLVEEEPSQVTWNDRRPDPDTVCYYGGAESFHHE